MLIKESTLRRIIREEAYRSLREQAPAPVAPTPALKKLIDPITTYLTAIVNSTSALPANANVKAALAQFQTNSSGNAYFAKNVATTISNVTKNTPLGIVRAILASMKANAIYKGASSGGPADYDSDLDVGVVGATDTVAPFEAAITKAVNPTAFITAVKAWCAAAAVAPVAAPAAATTHTVVSGDSISKIAQARYGITPSNASMPLYDQLAKTITNRAGATANKIQPGDIIILPATLGGKTLK
jgi:LysM repeat protein